MKHLILAFLLWCVGLSAQVFEVGQVGFTSRSASGGTNQPPAGGGAPAWTGDYDTNILAGQVFTNTITVSGANKMLLVGMSTWDTAGTLVGITNVTADPDVVFTLAAQTNVDTVASGSVGKIGFWYQLAPADGETTIVTGFSEAMSEVAISIILLTNVVQTDPIRSWTGNWGNGNRRLVTNLLASATTDLCLDTLATYVVGMTVGQNQTNIVWANHAANMDNYISTKAGAASVEMYWTNINVVMMDAVAISVKAP